MDEREIEAVARAFGYTPLLGGDSWATALLKAEKAVLALDRVRGARGDDEAARPLWCPVCKTTHEGEIGEQTDVGFITRACSTSRTTWSRPGDVPMPTRKPRVCPRPVSAQWQSRTWLRG
jgi:hypothetical protein